ncbi:RNA polymerase sigma factor [Marinicella sp. W31]|uniref:RNA polymerase sigma factor n=1 Tax=Marinicella sp. W31 TaxID=3023713 RepID=UPI003756A355
MSIKKLGKIFQKYQSQLYVVAITITKNRVYAEDAVHEALIAVAETSTRPKNLKAYLFKVVRTKAFYILKKSKTADINLESILDFECVSGEDQYLYKQIIEQVNQLDFESQQAITMKLLSGLTFKEIAETTDTSINTIASRYRRGLASIKEKLNES